MEENKTFESLKELAVKELSGLVAKNSLTPTEVVAAKETVCLIKEINNVIHKNEWHEETSGCHDRRMYYPNYEYAYGYDHSMARGRDPMTGRYVSRGEHHDMTNSGRRMYGTISYDGDISGHSIEDRVIDKIEGMMDSAKSNYERERLNQFIRVIDSMKGE